MVLQDTLPAHERLVFSHHTPLDSVDFGESNVSEEQYRGRAGNGRTDHGTRAHGAGGERGEHGAVGVHLCREALLLQKRESARPSLSLVGSRAHADELKTVRLFPPKPRSHEQASGKQQEQSQLTSPCLVADPICTLRFRPTPTTTPALVIKHAPIGTPPSASPSSPWKTACLIPARSNADGFAVGAVLIGDVGVSIVSKAIGPEVAGWIEG